MSDEEILGYLEIGDELVGDELVGDEAVEAMLGARRIKQALRRGGSRAARQLMSNPVASLAAQVMAAKRAATQTLVRDKSYSKSREWVIGLNSAAIVPVGAAATITQRPQVPFRGERLVIPTPVAVQFAIQDIRIGMSSQLPASGNIPGLAFVENAQGIRLQLDTCDVGQELTVLVINTSTVTPAFFNAALIGRAIGQ